MLGIEKLRIPQKQAIPAWYQLGLKNRHTLVVTIHEKAMEYLRSLEWTKAPIVCGIAEKFRFEDFIPPTESPWGFGRRTLFGSEAVFTSGPVPKKKNSQWISWECALPVFREDESHHKFMGVRASLTVLFQALEVFSYDGDTGWAKPQLMIVQGLSLEQDLHGGSLWVTLTPAMMSYLHKQPDDSELVEVARAMRSASYHMLGRAKEYNDPRDYRARCRQPKWIKLRVPGNACDLDPNEYHEKSLGVGYDLCPHNVDNSFQQLTFLMGLAKLHQLAQADNP